MEDWGYDPLLFLGPGENWEYISDLDTNYWNLIDEYEVAKNKYPDQFLGFWDFYKDYVFYMILTNHSAYALQLHIEVIDSSSDPDIEDAINDAWGRALIYSEYALREPFKPITKDDYAQALVIYDYDGNDPTLIERLYFEAGIEQGYSNPTSPGAAPTSPLEQFLELLYDLFGGGE